MTMRLFMRRRTERFAELLGEPATGRRHHVRSGHHTLGTDDRLAYLVRLGHGVSDRSDELTSHLAIDPGFKTDLRRRLMADAALHGIGATRLDGSRSDATESDRRPAPARAPRARSLRPGSLRPGSLRSRLIVVGCAVAGVLAIASVATASTSAVPGDPLYDVKRSTERAQLALAGSDLNSGELYLQFARTRAGEAGKVAGDGERLAAVLREMDRQTRHGVSLLDGTAVSRRDAASLTEVMTFAADQRPQLVTLVSGLDGTSRTRAIKSLALVDEVSRRAGDLRRQLTCTAGQPVRTDSLGPIPRECSALPGGKATASAPAGSDPSRSGESATPGSSSTHPKRHPGHGATPTPTPSGPLSGIPLPTGSPSSGGSSPPSDGSDGGGFLGTIGKILGGLL